MAEEICVKVFQFDELSEEAKEKAREWWREGFQYEEFDYEPIFDDAKEIGKLLGITIDNIYFTGFYSQGDGASFTGDYSYKKGSVKAIKDYAPTDKELHKLAKALADLQKSFFYGLCASIRPNHASRYAHEYSVTVGAYDNRENHSYDVDAQAEEELADLLRDFMRWIYRRLRDDFEYHLSDEHVDESCRINEYEFYNDGRRAWLRDADIVQRRCANGD